MILLDTNVVSEVMHPRPDPAVISWLNRQATVDLYLSTITLAEIRYGLAILPTDKRRRRLEDQFDLFVASGFDQRLLVFDERAAALYGDLMSRRRALGRPMSALDGQIAAIARAHGLAVATRNVRDFEECGVRIMNPFKRPEADS